MIDVILILCRAAAVMLIAYAFIRFDERLTKLEDKDEGGDA